MCMWVFKTLEMLLEAFVIKCSFDNTNPTWDHIGHRTATIHNAFVVTRFSWRWHYVYKVTIPMLPNASRFHKNTWRMQGIMQNQLVVTSKERKEYNCQATERFVYNARNLGREIWLWRTSKCKRLSTPRRLNMFWRKNNNLGQYVKIEQ